MMSIERNNELKLSAQRALLGNIPSHSNLRAISCEISEDNKIKFRCVFDGEVSFSDKEDLSVVATEIAADFSNSIIESEEYLTIPYPEKCPNLDVLVYLRSE